MQPIPVVFLLCFLTSTFMYSQEPRLHEPDLKQNRPKAPSDIYAKKPEKDFEKMQADILKDVVLKRKRYFEIENEIKNDPNIKDAWIHIPSERIEPLLADFRKRMKSPEGIRPDQYRLLQNSEKILSLAKEWQQASHEIDLAGSKLANLAVGKELCNSIYSAYNPEPNDTFIHSTKRNQFINYAGAKFTVKSDDNSYYTFCRHNGFSPSGIFVLHFDKDFKLVEVFQEDIKHPGIVYPESLRFSLLRRTVNTSPNTKDEKPTLHLYNGEKQAEDNPFQFAMDGSRVVIGRNKKTEVFNFDGIRSLHSGNEFAYPDK
mgnify:FL=1